jgi:hypothetical protein
VRHADERPPEGGNGGSRGERDEQGRPGRPKRRAEHVPPAFRRRRPVDRLPMAGAPISAQNPNFARRFSRAVPPAGGQNLRAIIGVGFCAGERSERKIVPGHYKLIRTGRPDGSGFRTSSGSGRGARAASTTGGKPGGPSGPGRSPAASPPPGVLPDRAEGLPFSD